MAGHSRTTEEAIVPVTENDAHGYRLLQAEQLLREAGYVEGPDGNWHRRDDDQPDDSTVTTK